MQKSKTLLTILGKMAQKSHVQFDNLFSKLYNVELWITAYQSIAPNPGNLTLGVDGHSIDGMNLKLISDLISDLKASRYKPRPVRRVYLPKPNNKGQRPIGIPCFRDKLLMTVLKLILEAIYEPTFSNASHGFRPQRSCHTALEEVKRMKGIRWWVEGDIKGFFNNLNHQTLVKILSKRITDQRFLHLIGQFLKAGYIENWQYHKTYSGVAQGGNLSPVLSNLYLNEFDQMMAIKIAEFKKGQKRRQLPQYRHLQGQQLYAKKKARQSGDWTQYKALKREVRSMQSTDPYDPNFRRLTYLRYCDDWLVGVIGSHAEAVALKDEIGEYLQQELQLELSAEKTLVTNAKQRVRFLGYDVKRWKGVRHLKFRTRYGVRCQRTTNYHLALLLPHDKALAFGQKYGDTSYWDGKRRSELVNFSELEILMTYNAEVRGFLGYYALADNLKVEARRILKLTTDSFMHTIASKRHCTIKKVISNYKRGPSRYVISLKTKTKSEKIREYELLSSTRQLKQSKVSYAEIDHKPNTWKYRSRNELSKRLLAQQCEWCGTQEGEMEVHHVRKLSDLKGKTDWERQMIGRKRKTMVLCQKCHVALHAGTLSEKNRVKGKRESVVLGN